MIFGALHVVSVRLYSLTIAILEDADEIYYFYFLVKFKIKYGYINFL